MKVKFQGRGGATSPVSAMLLGGAVWCAAAAAQANMLAATDLEARYAQADCANVLMLHGVQRALQVIKVQLQSQGLRLQIQACPYVRTSGGSMQQVLDVRVWVIDSDIAARYVRGPLADAQEVDMGDVQLSRNAQSTASAQDDVSPDILFNRTWLAKVMTAQGLHAVPGHWWAFVPGSKK